MKDSKMKNQMGLTIQRFKDAWKFIWSYLRVLIGIAITIGIGYVFISSGWRGFIMFLLGMAAMAAILLSKNPMVTWFIRQFNAELYMQEVSDGREVKGENGDKTDAKNEDGNKVDAKSKEQ